MNPIIQKTAILNAWLHCEDTAWETLNESVFFLENCPFYLCDNERTTIEMDTSAVIAVSLDPISGFNLKPVHFIVQLNRNK